MKSSGSDCWSVVDPKRWPSPAPRTVPLQPGVTRFLCLNLHLLQVLVGRVFIAMVLHLVQVALFGGEHWVDLEERDSSTGFRRAEVFAGQSPGDHNQPGVSLPLYDPNKSGGEDTGGEKGGGGSMRQCF